MLSVAFEYMTMEAVGQKVGYIGSDKTPDARSNFM
jgi:hypothetical protein